LGRQKGDLSGAEIWVLPNPSGLNAHETIATLSGWFTEVGKRAGLL
jgi:TDG/mug DNA glycosylase family protein